MFTFYVIVIPVTVVVVYIRTTIGTFCYTCLLYISVMVVQSLSSEDGSILFEYWMFIHECVLVSSLMAD